MHVKGNKQSFHEQIQKLVKGGRGNSYREVRVQLMFIWLNGIIEVILYIIMAQCKFMLLLIFVCLTSF